MSSHAKAFNALLLNAMGDPAGHAMLASAGARIRCVPAAPTPHADALTLAQSQVLCVRLPGAVGADLLQRMPALRVIAAASAGIDNIDLQTASHLGIAVVNCPGVGAGAVAEHAVGMMLGLARRLALADRTLRRDGWSCREAFFSEPGPELSGKRLGIVGLGAIGSRVARICRDGFGMTIVAYSPTTPASRFDALETERVDDLAALCGQVDFLVITAPATPATRHLIGKAQLTALPAHAFLINVSRGSLVDHAALELMLRERRLAGAALDVFEHEPLGSSNALFGMDHVLLSPHVAGASREAHRERAILSAQQVIHIMRGDHPAHLLNPEVMKHTRQTHAPAVAAWEG